MDLLNAIISKDYNSFMKIKNDIINNNDNNDDIIIISYEEYKKYDIYNKNECEKVYNKIKIVIKILLNKNEQSNQWMTTHESKHGQYGPKEHFVPHVRLSCKWFETYASSSTETTYAIVQP